MNHASITTADRLVERSVTSYATHHRKYDHNHPEIFNPVEQVRLRRELAQVIADSGEDRPHALDLGAGSGNVTAHLLGLGAEVTAAEVSPHFIGVLRARFGAGVHAVQINGVDLTGLPDETFHIVTLYSVLHHIPDYVGIVDEIARVLRPGGQVYFDHEVTEAYWEADGCAKQLARESREFRRKKPGLWNPDRHRWQRFLVPGRYLHAIRTRRDPDYMVHREGDIHVTADDHIEWPKLIERVVACGLTVGRAGEYLNYDASNPLEIWTRYRDRGCTDMRYLVARKEAHGSAANRG
jgi:ubiquinone/menaquinone biosynthesis C-methylase UbiE